MTKNIISLAVIFPSFYALILGCDILQDQEGKEQNLIISRELASKLEHGHVISEDTQRILEQIQTHIDSNQCQLVGADGQPIQVLLYRPI